MNDDSSTAYRGDPIDDEPPDDRTIDDGTIDDVRQRRRSLLLAGAALLALLAIALLYPVLWGERVLPGVRAAGIELRGLSEQDAAAKLSDELPGLGATIELLDIDDGRSWTVDPRTVGLPWSADYLAALAMEAGRGNPWAPFAAMRGVDVAENLRLDEGTAMAGLAAIAPEVDVPPRDAGVALVNGLLEETPPQLGRQLDMEATLSRLRAAAPRPDELPVLIETTRTAPRILTDEGVAQAYTVATGQPLVLRWRNDFEWVVPTATLQTWFSIVEITGPDGDRRPSVSADIDAMRRWVSERAPEVARPPRPARFAWTAQGVSLVQPEQEGLAIDVEATVQRIIEIAYRQQRVGEPEMIIRRPSVTQRNLEALQGLQPIARSAVPIGGLPAERLTNILAAAERFEGLAIAPNQNFSFNEFLGPVDAAAGFLPTLLRPWPADGLVYGGIDQVATAAFRAVLAAGLPVAERHAPTRRSGWLEPPVGIDAAVAANDGGADLRWINDTNGHLLLEVRPDQRRQALGWVIYGRRTGRQVNLKGPFVASVVPAAEPTERGESGLARGVTMQLAWPREGAQAVFERIITSRDGTVGAPERFTSNYQAAGAVVVVGTGPPTP